MNDERKIPAPGRAVMDPKAPLCFIGCPNEPGRVCSAWTNATSDPRWEQSGDRERPTQLEALRGDGGSADDLFMEISKLASEKDIAANGPNPPPPRFGLRVSLSRTARVVAALVAAGEHGIERDRLAPLLYMADVHAREGGHEPAPPPPMPENDA